MVAEAVFRSEEKAEAVFRSEEEAQSNQKLTASSGRLPNHCLRDTGGS